MNIVESYLSDSNQRLALGDGNIVITGHEVAERVYDLATEIHRQTERHGPQQHLVAIYLPRNIDYLIAIFASWLSGNYYLPLNVNWPYSHLKDVMDRAKPAVVIAENNSELKETCVLSPRNPLQRLTPTSDEMATWRKKSSETDSLAYLIYTSGSTGVPKGVPIQATSLVQYMDWNRRSFPTLSTARSLLINGEMTFDISIADICAAISHSLEIHITSDPRNILELIYILKKRNIGSLYAVPNTLGSIYGLMERRSDKLLQNLSHIFSGGDVFDMLLFKKLRSQSPNAEIYNMYGPTEVTINCLAIRLDTISEKIFREGLVPTGEAFPHLNYILIDEYGSESEEFGFLHVAGGQTFRGYLDDDKINNATIKTIAGLDYFNTGDLFRVVDGIYYFQGRGDSQVKYRGFRVDLTYITNKILATGLAEAAVVIIGSEPSGQKCIVAFVTPRLDVVNRSVIDAIKLECIRELPHYMVPKYIVDVDSLPTGGTGKIDRRALMDYFVKWCRAKP